MKKKTFTCPFTGISFDATEFADGTIIAINPLTGDEVRMRLNASINHFYIRPGVFNERKTASYAECARMLDVTVQRVNALVKSEMLISHELPNGDKVILVDDIEKYAKTRKTGRPRKEMN